MMISVLAAFFASGGLNAGTPLAIASTPVSATDPPANALSSSRRVKTWVPGCSANAGGLRWCAAPVAVFTSPTAIASRAIPTKR